MSRAEHLILRALAALMMRYTGTRGDDDASLLIEIIAAANAPNLPEEGRRDVATESLVAAAPDLYDAVKRYTQRGHRSTCSAMLSEGCECDCGYAIGVCAIAKAEEE